MEDKWQELQAIEKQRSDIVTKLQRIEEKKSTVSHEVYEKVKQEYDEKLNHINQQMAQHAELIKEHLGALDQEEVELKEKEKEVQLKVEEIELRYSIGEYGEEDYQESNTAHRKSIEDIEEKIGQIHQRRAWLKNFVDIEDHAEVMVPEVKPAEQEQESVAEEVAEEVLQAPTEEIPAAPVEEVVETPAEETPESPVEEVIEESVEEISGDADTPAEANSEEPASAAEEADDGIKIEEHILEEKLPEEDTKLDELIVEEEAVLPKLAEEEKAAPAEALPKKDEEKEKSVGCPKCGHLNKPDSWYCEKCGAEILDAPVS